MRVLATVLAACGVPLLAFGFWGTHAAAARFGDGSIPIAVSCVGGLLVIAGVAIDMAAERARKKAAS